MNRARPRPAYRGSFARALRIGFGLAIGLGAGAFGAASAQETYPTRPVRMLVTFPPGGPSDILARILADKLSASLKAPFVVENRPGAGGNIGAAAAAGAAPDGYTVLFGIDTTFTVNPSLYKSMPFRLDDVRPLVLLGLSGLTVGVHPSLGVNSLKELIEKGRREALTFSSGSNGSPGHLAASILAERSGAQIMHVPYKGNTQAVTAVVAGEVQGGILATPGFLPHVQAGRVKALAVTSGTRSALTPELPTVAEAGLPDLQVEVLYLSWVPAKTPAPIVATLQKEIAAALKLPDVEARLRKLDITVLGEFGPAVQSRIDRTRDRYAATIKATGMKID